MLWTSDYLSNSLPNDLQKKNEVSVPGWLCLQGQAEQTGIFKHGRGTYVGSTLVEVNTKMTSAEGINMDLWTGRLKWEKKTLTHRISFFPCTTEFKLWNAALLFLDGLKCKLILKGTGKTGESWLMNTY